MFQPQPMPGAQKPFDPWNEKPEMDPNDPWSAGGMDTGMGQPLPGGETAGAPMDGMSKGGMLSMPGQMGGGGGMMKPAGQMGAGNPMAAMAGAAAGGLAGQPSGMGGMKPPMDAPMMKPPMGGPMMKPQPMPPMGAGGSMGGPMPGGMPHAGMGGMLRQLLMRKMQGGQ